MTLRRKTRTPVPQTEYEELLEFLDTNNLRRSVNLKTLVLGTEFQVLELDDEDIPALTTFLQNTLGLT